MRDATLAVHRKVQKADLVTEIAGEIDAKAHAPIVQRIERQGP